MSGSAALERRYRRLIVLFPAEHRREYAEEMIGVLLASAPRGRRRPGLADALDLIAGGLRARLRRRGSSPAGARQRDALAVCSLVLPVMTLAALTVSYLWNLLPTLDFSGVSDFYLPALALALPALTAMRYRRTAAMAAIVAAGWFWFLLIRSATIWIDGLEASYCIALLVQGIALAGSPGPRRAAAIMTWRTWLVLAAAGLTMGAASLYYPWSLDMWQAAAVVLAFLAAVGAGLAVTLPAPTALRLLLLLAVPAVPCTVWVLQFAAAMTGNATRHPFPVLAFLPTLLLLCIGTALAWQARRGSKTT